MGFDINFGKKEDLFGPSNSEYVIEYLNAGGEIWGTYELHLVELGSVAEGELFGSIKVSQQDKGVARALIESLPSSIAKIVREHKIDILHKAEINFNPDSDSSYTKLPHIFEEMGYKNPGYINRENKLVLRKNYSRKDIL